MFTREEDDNVSCDDLDLENKARVYVAEGDMFAQSTLASNIGNRGVLCVLNVPRGGMTAAMIEDTAAIHMRN